ncbi:RHS protein [Burkholderia lata]|uniref:RHS protein n=1 Tax=Burkholderia lata (strain ATCC 17760 / DSM 23089 / LMG 22485 / NCIMB 9086 / R18194 / 383) TaxID=482957 RepID=A0A6P2URA8_BURL3|nr:RHS protein [Burkholderia lata]
MTDRNGKVVWRTRYRAWGNTVLQEYAQEFQPNPVGDVMQPLPQTLRFQGQYEDLETGFCYNTFRYYDPDVGRFITPDPIGLAGGLNQYQYAPNPVTWIDPWGWAVTPLDAPGHSTYGLYEPGATEPYYVGHTGQSLNDRLGEHIRTGRATQGQTQIRPLGGNEGTLTYSQSKGYEQAYREKYDTKKGFPSNVIEPIDKTRMDERGLSHMKFYDEKAEKLGLKSCGS